MPLEKLGQHTARFAAAGAFLLLLHVLLPARALAQDMKHVLVLHSYHKGLAWTDSEDQGIRAALQARAGELEVQVAPVLQA